MREFHWHIINDRPEGRVMLIRASLQPALGSLSLGSSFDTEALLFATGGKATLGSDRSRQEQTGADKSGPVPNEQPPRPGHKLEAWCLKWQAVPGNRSESCDRAMSKVEGAARKLAHTLLSTPKLVSRGDEARLLRPATFLACLFFTVGTAPRYVLRTSCLF